MSGRNLFLGLTGVLLLHHYVIHPELHGLNRVFQIQDISNHETWVVLLLALAFVSK